MKMTMRTIQELTKAREIFGEREFTAVEWDTNIGITLDTAIRHKAVIRINYSSREYYTVPEIVQMLNGCAGEDCYSCDWSFQIDENGRVFQEIIHTTYKMAQ